MVFFIDDMLLRMLSFSIPPFDLIWIMEILHDHSVLMMEEENIVKINALIKEKRLLYELNEITREEYETTFKLLSHQRKTAKKEKGVNFRYRINQFGK